MEWCINHIKDMNTTRTTVGLIQVSLISAECVEWLKEGSLGNSTKIAQTVLGH